MNFTSKRSNVMLLNNNGRAFARHVKPVANVTIQLSVTTSKLYSVHV